MLSLSSFPLMKNFFFVRLFSLFALNIFAVENKSINVLCADIGGTRVKAAILHPGITLQELQAITTVAIDSQEWLNDDLPLLFSFGDTRGLPQKFTKPIDQICFGVRSPVKDGKCCVVPKEHLPRDIKHLCQEVSNRPVFVECDTGIWARGAIYWHNLIQKDISFPCLGITFGTGIGVALFKTSDDIVNIEISLLDTPYKRLFEETEEQPIKIEYDRPAPHDAMGKPFFLWVEKEHPDWSDEKIQEVFNKRILGFLIDMQEYLQIKENVTIDSFMIGGGNSRLIDSKKMQKALGKQFIVLNVQNVSQYGVSPDIISLLGCLVLPQCSPVKMMPCWDEMMPWYTPVKETSSSPLVQYGA